MRRLQLGLALAALLLSATAVSAQVTTGSISGRIVDAQGLAVPGVTVTATGAQGTKAAVTDTEGRFTIPFLTPGTYAIRAELQGFAPIERSGLQVRLGQTIDLPLTMQVAGVSETVQVTGTPTTIDTTSTTIGANLDSATLARLPVGRRFSDTLYLAPGVSSGGTVGAANPSVSGSSGLENQYVIDGVNITNGGYGALGSYSIVFGSLGNGTPYDFMQEVQVRTGGYEAEFGQATGGVIQVVTKSGSNDLTGSAFVYGRPTALESNFTEAQSVNGTVNTVGTRLNDAGATVGLPLIRDHLFFFGAIDPQWETRTLAAPAGFPLEGTGSNGGNFDRDRRVVNYAAKGTWQITPSHRIDASFFGDPATGDMGPQRTTSLLNTTTSAFSALDYGGHNQTIRYSGVLRPTFTIDASIARALNTITETPSVNEWFVRDRTVTPFVTTGGIGFFEAGNRSNNWQYEAHATNILSAAGQHSLKYGFDIEHLNYDQVNQRTGPTFTTPTGEQTATGAQIDILSDPNFGRIFRVVRANLNAARSTSQTYTGLFVEDTWQIGNNITINPGLRYEQEKLAGTIVTDFNLKNNWAPRIGATWDPTGSGKAKIFANYGRYYARVPNDLAARALSSDAAITADYFDANLTQPIPNGVLAGPVGSQTPTHYTLLGGGADLIDPNAKLSYYNEVVVGAQREMFQGLTLGARYIHRDIGRVLEDVQPFPVIATSLGIPAATTADYILTNPGPSTQVSQVPGLANASFEAPVHNYNAIEITAEKRFGNNWSLQSSYRYSRLRGTYEGFYRDDNGQSDPGITSLYDFPTNDPTYATVGANLFGYQGDIRYLGHLGSGPLPLDRPHDIKVYGSYAFRFGLNLAAGVQVTSGKPLTALAAHPVYLNGGEIPLTPRGAGFQTSEGFETRAPWTHTVNAQASYRIGFGGRRGLMLIADAFNLFNSQTVLDYDSFFESAFGVSNPDFGLAGVSSVIAGQQFTTPRQFRLGARLEL